MEGLQDKQKEVANDIQHIQDDLSEFGASLRQQAVTQKEMMEMLRTLVGMSTRAQQTHDDFPGVFQ